MFSSLFRTSSLSPFFNNLKFVEMYERSSGVRFLQSPHSNSDTNGLSFLTLGLLTNHLMMKNRAKRTIKNIVTALMISVV
jgi:hypothetical protein